MGLTGAFVNTGAMIPDNKVQMVVYVDGASSGNPGPGGWGAIIADPTGKVVEIGGHEPHTTNNRMELTASIRGLEKIEPEKSEISVITLYSDSTYVIQGITKWIFAWQKRGWLTADGKSVANADLWQELLTVSKKHRIVWKHVRGHSGVPGNVRADEIAVSYSKKQNPDLYEGLFTEYSVSLLPTSIKAGKLPTLGSLARSAGLAGSGKKLVL